MHDASVNPSIHVADAAIDPREVILQDVSVDQTPKEQLEVSAQYSRAVNEISIQMDSISRHEVSIQQVPILVDETVHMSREEDDIAIQCNAENQSISIQYSAKPLFQEHQQDL